MSNTHKREWRELSDEQRKKISQATSNKPKSATHRLHISQAMKDYWRGVPHRPDTEPEDMPMDEFLGAR